MAVNVNKINQSNNFNTRLTRPKVNRQYSALKMQYTIQGSGDMGYFIPTHYQELLPGQKISFKQEIGIQFMPFVSNLLHEIEGESLTYFVPYRILWDKWEDFITGGKDGQNNDTPPIFSLKSKTWLNYSAKANQDLFKNTFKDALGLPITFSTEDWNDEDDREHLTVQAFIAMAYDKIWDEHIRIPDLEEERFGEVVEDGTYKGFYDSVTVGPNGYTGVPGTESFKQVDRRTFAPCHWSWDYFTRARIYQQRGAIPTVPVQDIEGELQHEIQMGGWADDKWAGTANSRGVLTGLAQANMPQNPTYFGIGRDEQHEDSILQVQANSPAADQNVRMRILPHDLTGLGIDLNDFLTALGIMRVQVNNAKIETRYSDHLNVRWGVYPEDARLQMPEYLGMDAFSVRTDTVTNTGEDQGNITGQAWAGQKGKTIEYEAKEHGILMTITAIRPKTSYERGIDRILAPRKTRFDFPTPELANLPDVQILKKELSVTGGENKEEGEQAFGWQGIYEEYRTNVNFVTGALRPSLQAGLKSYTLARYWSKAPELNKEFIQCKPDKDRIMMYPDEPTFIYFVRNETNTAIPLPIQSEPAMLGTF